MVGMEFVPTSGGSVQTPQSTTFFAGLRSAGGASISAILLCGIFDEGEWITARALRRIGGCSLQLFLLQLNQKGERHYA